MRLHLAERDPQHHAWAKRGVDKRGLKLKILLSYHYYKDIDLDALFAKYFTEPYPDVFADSGAFSAATQGAEISLRDYAAWIRRWNHLFCTYANLDVIGDSQATWQNQEVLEAEGLAPLPVFHTGSDFKELERLIERYPYIALGGMVPYTQRIKPLMRWLVQCFRLAEGKSVFHGFGATSWQVISQLPWYSVDSSSWGQGFRFGEVPLFDYRRGRFTKLMLGARSDWIKNASLVRAMGFDPLDFADRDRNDRAKICTISALSYMLAERWLKNFHGEVKIPSLPAKDVPLTRQVLNEAGPRLHLADANPKRFGEAVSDVSGLRLHLADTSSCVNFGDAERGLKLYLAEANGGWDVSRAMEVLRKKEGVDG